MADLPPTFVEGFHDEAAVRKMTYNKLGRTGLIVSKLSIGGGILPPYHTQADESEAILTIQKAIRSGINYIDTAPYYGQGTSEKIIGKALKEIPREAYYIATKIGRFGPEIENQFDFTAGRTKESVDTSLRYLGLDSIDIIQIHDIEFAEDLDIIVSETLPALEEVKKQGKAKFIGLTGYPLDKLKEMILRAPGRFDTVLSYARYTMLDDSLLEYLPFFLEQGLGVISGAGHALGILTNRGPYDWHIASPEIRKPGRLAGEYCGGRGVELAKLAMWYASQLEGTATFLAGMATRKALDCNLDSICNGLTPREADALKYCMDNFFQKKFHWEGLELRSFFDR